MVPGWWWWDSGGNLQLLDVLHELLDDFNDGTRLVLLCSRYQLTYFTVINYLKGSYGVVYQVICV